MLEHDDNTLPQHFEEVKRIFFPKWSDSKQWTVSVVDDSGNDFLGRCDSKSKNIEITEIPSTKDDLWSLLIHELCHAVADNVFYAGHGEAWLDQMGKAVEVAHEHGMSNLADMLRKDSEGHATIHARLLVQQNAFAPGSILDETLLPAMISDLLMESRRDRSFEAIISWLGIQCGEPAAGLVKRFPRIREIYEAAKKDVEESEEIERRHRELINQQGQ